MSGDNTSTTPVDTDVRLSLVRLEERVQAMQRQSDNQGATMREGFKVLGEKIGEGLGKNADVMEKSLANFQANYVSKTDFAPLAFQMKIVWAVLVALGGLVLTMVTKGILAGVKLG